VSEQANAMTKQGFDQHNLLHLQWPQNCCLCRAETNLAALRAENERMMQDHIRLCGALGLDADAHIDMLAEAAERLRAENERLHEALACCAALKGDAE